MGRGLLLSPYYYYLCIIGEENMKEKKMEELEMTDGFELDVDNSPAKMVEVSIVADDKPKKVRKKEVRNNEDEVIIPSCLSNKTIIVRHIPKRGGMIDNPKHILYGGMAENASRYFSVPRLQSGLYVNVLTDNEKTFLEQVMDLEPNALSIYKKGDNFWDNRMVRLTKQDTRFNLSNPDEYISYKILLANKDYIAPSLHTLENKPKATYQFVCIEEGEETQTAKDNMSVTMKCYREFGKIEDNVDTLRTIIELIGGRPTSPNTKLEFLQTQINQIIQSDNKRFLRVVTDPLLQTKVLIKRAIEEGLISKRGDQLYLRSDNTPLCSHNEEPTLETAARYLNSPKHQDLKFSLEAKLK